jgi:hypothetical protein
VRDVNNVIEFKSSTNYLYDKKLKRKEYLSSRIFNQNITDDEERELNELCKWLGIHNI